MCWKRGRLCCQRRCGLLQRLAQARVARCRYACHRCQHWCGHDFSSHQNRRTASLEGASALHIIMNCRDADAMQCQNPTKDRYSQAKRGLPKGTLDGAGDRAAEDSCSATQTCRQLHSNKPLEPREGKRRQPNKVY